MLRGEEKGDPRTTPALGPPRDQSVSMIKLRHGARGGSESNRIVVIFTNESEEKREKEPRGFTYPRFVLAISG